MKVKKIIVIGIIIFIILIVGVSIMIKYLDNKSEKIAEETGDPGIVIDYDSQTTQKVTDFVNYYTVVDCVDAYIDRLNIRNSSYYGMDENNNYSLRVSDEDINKNIYDLLSKEYTENNGITVENLREHIEVMEQDTVFVPLQMRELVNSVKDRYLVQGFLTDINSNFIKEIYVYVNWDVSNNTFSIEPIPDGTIKNIDEIQIVNNNEAIEKNALNTVTEAKVNYEYLCKKHLENYKKILLCLPELAYEYLDDEYKQERFGSYEKFQEYLTDNHNAIFGLSMARYNVNTYEDYRQYVCVDNRGNYYLFNETDIMDYKVQLDTYTIKSEEYLKAYNDLTQSQKTSFNLSTFIQMINTKDYTHAYKTLSEGFRNNYFPDEESFKNYIKDNFYDYNVLEITSSKNEGNIFIFNCLIKNGKNDAENKTMNFNVLLGEGTDFTLSFNV